jgi:hypothetical protein
MAVSLFVTPARLADGLEAKKSSADRSAAPRSCIKTAKHLVFPRRTSCGFGSLHLGKFIQNGQVKARKILAWWHPDPVVLI